MRSTSPTANVKLWIVCYCVCMGVGISIGGEDGDEFDGFDDQAGDGTDGPWEGDEAIYGDDTEEGSVLGPRRHCCRHLENTEEGPIRRAFFLSAPPKGARFLVG